MPIDVRPEAIFELAKLTIWLEDRIIKKKKENASMTYLPRPRAFGAGTPTIQERIEITARICTDKIWKRSLNDSYRRFPLVIGPQDDAGHDQAVGCFPNVNHRGLGISIIARPSVTSIGLLGRENASDFTPVALINASSLAIKDIRNGAERPFFIRSTWNECFT